MPSEGHAARKTIVGTVLGGLIFSLLHGWSGSFDPPWTRLKNTAISLFSSQQPELPIPNLFLIFLFVFVLLGLLPALQRTISRIEEYLRTLAEEQGPTAVGAEGEPEEMLAEPQEILELYEFEVMVLTRLARAGSKGLSLKHLTGDLLLDPKVAKQTLESLSAKGLVWIVKTYVIGTRFYVSGKGREYAVRQGLLRGPRRRSGGRGHSRLVDGKERLSGSGPDIAFWPQTPTDDQPAADQDQQ